MTELGLNRNQRQRKLGIDCPDRLLWKSWDVGEEHERKIIIKNIDSRTQTISYKLPQAKTTFIMDYPEPVTLSSGMSLELSVRFCPSESIELHDAIEVTVKGRGTFLIYLDCLTPFAKLSAPKSEDFGYVAVLTTCTKTISIKNVGTVALDFYWEIPEPFSISPSMGTLPVGESLPLQVSFTPGDALVCVAQAVCKMSDNEEVISAVQLSGVGKYPFIRFLRDTEEIVEKPVNRRAALVEPVDQLTSLMNFKEVLVGNTVVSEAIIENPSPVSATVTVSLVDEDIPSAFTVAPSSAGEQTFVIPSGGKKEFKLSFKARDAGTAHRSVFQWRTLAGNSIFLETKGVVVGPRVKSSASHLNFGNVDLEKLTSEKERTKAIQLKNVSDCPADFQFMSTAVGAVFAVSPCTGTIPAKGNVVVKITFQPTVPMNYLRRIYILVKDAADALQLDAFGTAYNQESRPLSFGLPQVDAFFLRLARGLGQRTPEELEQIANAITRELPALTEEDHQVYNTWREIEMQTNSTGTLQQQQQEGGVTLWSQKRSARVSFPQTLPYPPHWLPFSVETKSLLFDPNAPQTQTVAVFNSTPCMATAVWSVPRDSPFVVSPQQQDVQPNETVHFHVSIRSQPYGGGSDKSSGGNNLTQFIECYMNYKQMRSFRLVDEKSFTPPHCFTVLCSIDRTHASSSLSSAAAAGAITGATEAATLVSFNVPRVTFPSVKVGQSSFRITSIENKSDTDFYYELRGVNIGKVTETSAKNVYVHLTFADGSTKSVPFMDHDASEENSSSAALFNCFPATGVVAAKAQTLILLQFQPTLHANYEGEASFTLNHNVKDCVKLPLAIESNIPRLIWEDCDEKIIFCPTCVTGETSRRFRLRNPSSLPLSFRFEWSTELLSVARAEPADGAIGPNARMEVTLFFSPEKARKHTGKLDVVVMDLQKGLEHTMATQQADTEALLLMGAQVEEGDAVGGDVSELDHFKGEEAVLMREYVATMPVVGEGAHAVLEMEPSTISLPDVDCGTPQVVTFNLYNSGTCAVQYQMRHFLSKEPEGWHNVMRAPLFHNSIGILPARSHTTVLVTIEPTVGLCEYIFYALLSGPGTDLTAVADPTAIEEIRENPHCVVTMSGTRPAIQIADVRSLSVQRSQLWASLSINDINEQLAAAVQPTDLDASAFEFPQFIQGLTPIYMQLGNGQLHSAHNVMSLQLVNTGDCETSFKILFPGESDVQEETWYMEDRALQDVQFIMDHNIVEIFPRSGSIPVGGSVVLHLMYRFTHVGAHTLPMLLRVDEGKKTLVVLQGQTVDSHDPILNTALLEKNLTPVALGDMEPPLQSITLHNPTKSTVNYSVDFESLQTIMEENYGFPVLQCVNPSGTIAPRGALEVNWYFRPLEAREYTFTVPIHLRQLTGDHLGLATQTGSGEERLMTFTFNAQGFHPKRIAPDQLRRLMSSAFLALPPTPSLRLPMLPVTLSLDVCHFGVIPYFSLHRRTCNITNHHSTDRYSFQWEVKPQQCGVLTVVSPARGVLLPGQSVSCKVSLYAGSTCQFLERSIMCVVTNETFVEQETLQADRDIVAVTYTKGANKKKDGDINIVDPPERPNPASTNKKAKKHESVSTIPNKYLSTRALEKKLEQQNDSYGAATVSAALSNYYDGEAVVWNALELFTQAHVIPVEQYTTCYGREQMRHLFVPVLNFIDNNSGTHRNSEKRSTSEKEQRISDKKLFTKENMRPVLDILNNMLRTIVNQPEVRTAFQVPCSNSTTTYAELVQRQKEKKETISAGSASEKEEKAKNNKEKGTKEKHVDANKNGQQVQNFMYNIVEEALESVLFDSILKVGGSVSS